jgi:hypothetical protein
MLTPTQYTAPVDKIYEVMNNFNEARKYDLTKPTGDFFYDQWVLKDEFKGTAWEEIYNSLPIKTGQARIIVLEGGTGYYQHADIDDRYHLNLRGDGSYLINLENKIMHQLHPDGVWYEMDAGILHSAASFGRDNRVQLVVRKLLDKAELSFPIQIEITATGEKFRYDFDNTISPWLNRANKRKIINNFKNIDTNKVIFNIEKDFFLELKNIVPNNFIIKECK